MCIPQGFLGIPRDPSGFQDLAMGRGGSEHRSMSLQELRYGDLKTAVIRTLGIPAVGTPTRDQ